MPLFQKPPPRQPGLLDHLVKAAVTATTHHALTSLGHEIAARHGEDSLLARVTRAGQTVIERHADHRHSDFEAKADTATGYRGQIAAGVARTFQTTIREQQQAAQIPSGEQCYALGRHADQSRNEGQALQWFELGANQRHLGCINALAACYEQGSGVPANMQQALLLYREAAGAGYISAQSNLAILFFEAGQLEESAFWARKAAEAGDDDAQYITGYYCEHGKGGVARNLAEARRWYQLSAAQHVQRAIDALAAMDAQSREQAKPASGGPQPGTGDNIHKRESPEWAAHELSVMLDASREEINLAWRKWVKIAHSDAGGDDHWAADLNLARGILLARLA
jgi:hypothetical protein